MFGQRVDHGTAVKFLESHNYKDVKPLSKGSFGEVLSAISPHKIQVAIKVITKESYREIEDVIWPCLNHPNVLPVLDVMSVPDMELRLFVSPLHPTALCDMVHGREFLADVRGLDRVRRWLLDTLNGLDYLHTARFAHMDMKSDNVLITASDSAVICDFSGLSITERKISRFGSINRS